MLAYFKSGKFLNLLLFLTIALLFFNGFMICAGSSVITEMIDTKADPDWVQHHIHFWNTLVRVEKGLFIFIALTSFIKIIKYLRKKLV